MTDRPGGREMGGYLLLSYGTAWGIWLMCGMMPPGAVTAQLLNTVVMWTPALAVWLMWLAGRRRPVLSFSMRPALRRNWKWYLAAWALLWTDKITEKGGMRRGRAGQRGKTQEYQGIAGLDGGTMGGCSHLSCPGRASSASTLFFHAQTGRNRRGTGRADESAEIPGNHENQGFPGISAWYIWKDPMGAR